MQVVMVYDVTDGYTFSCTETIPVEYSSVEQALSDFESSLKAAHQKTPTMLHSQFEFAGMTFHSDDFYWRISNGDSSYDLPEFLTVDEWFNKYGVNR
jgi:hypothetical protein